MSLRPPRARRSPLWLALVAWLVAGFTARAEAPASDAGLTLAQAVAAALADGHSAQIARLEAERSVDAAGEQRSAYLPKAKITSNAGYNSRQNEKLSAINGAGQLREYGLSSLGSDEGWFNVYLDQLLLDLATWHRMERADLEAEAAGIGEEQEREAVAYEVLQRFTNVIRQESHLGLARDRVQASAALDQQAALLLEAGRARPADRAQVALLLAEAELERDERQAAATSARAALALAMGRERGAIVDPLDATSLPAPAAGDGDADPQDVDRSPELRVLDLRRRVEEKNVDIARAGYLPTVGVRGGYSHYGVKRFDNYPDALQVGVNVEVPIFEGLRNLYAVDGAAKTAEIARLKHRSRAEAKRARVRELAARLAATSELAELAHRRADVSKERLRLAELNLRADRGTLEEALAALGERTRDGSAAVDAGLDRVLLWAELRRETGTLAQAIAGPPPSPN